MTTRRTPTHQFVGSRAAELSAEYQSLREEKGRDARRRDRAIQREALDLLHEIGAPLTLIELFDIMFGEVTKQVNETPEHPWLHLIIDYEARAAQEGREVTTSELVDKVVMPSRPQIGSRQGALKPQKFCKTRCRRAFHSAARLWAEREIEEGRLTVKELRVAMSAFVPITSALPPKADIRGKSANVR